MVSSPSDIDDRVSKACSCAKALLPDGLEEALDNAVRLRARRSCTTASTRGPRRAEFRPPLPRRRSPREHNQGLSKGNEEPLPDSKPSTPPYHSAKL